MPTRTPAATITNTPVKPDSNPPASGTSSYTGNTGSSHVKAMPKTGDNTKPRKMDRSDLRFRMRGITGSSICQKQKRKRINNRIRTAVRQGKNFYRIAFF